jgi:hypothetical protein
METYPEAAGGRLKKLWPSANARAEAERKPRRPILHGRETNLEAPDMSDARYISLTPVYSDAIAREKCTEQLRAAIAVFNTSPDPAERTSAIGEIRRLRALLKSGEVDSRGIIEPAHFTPGAVVNMHTFKSDTKFNHGSNTP